MNDAAVGLSITLLALIILAIFLLYFGVYGPWQPYHNVFEYSGHMIGGMMNYSRELTM